MEAKQDKSNEEQRQLQQAGVGGSALSVSEAFEALRSSALGEAWNKVRCVCAALGRGKCDLACKEYDDELL